MNGKPGDPTKANLPDLKPSAEEALEELKPLIRPGKESEAGGVLEAYFESHRGPLPPARELRNYDLVLPGAAERIVAMAEREQEHRHTLESKIVTEEVGLRQKGQIAAFIALLGMLAIVALFIVYHAPVQGAWFGGVVIIGVVTAFLGQRILKRVNNDDEEPINTPQQNSNARGAIRAQQTNKGRNKGKRR